MCMALYPREKEVKALTMSRDYNYRRMIQSTRWLKLRKEKLKRSPLCEDCLSDGLFRPAEEIHHVRPCESSKSVEEMERLMFDINNLRSLCHDCHVLTHKNMKSRTKEASVEAVKSNVERFKRRWLD